jgi:peptidoglycan/LPS O-acetylase OafA/YrhL
MVSSTRNTNDSTILPLTSIRFFAAFYVVLHHSVTWSHHVDTSTWIGRFLKAGYTGVDFFFLLSGYILSHVYLSAGRSFTPGSFWISRFARAYPLLVVSMLLDLPRMLADVLSVHGPASSAARLIFALLSGFSLLQAWDAHFRWLNPVSWSLSAEAFFYLLFPFVSFWIWSRKGAKSVFLFLGLWACAQLVPAIASWRYPNMADGSFMQSTILYVPILRMFEFLAGIALCAVDRSFVQNRTLEQRRVLSYFFLAGGSISFAAVIGVSSHITLISMSNGLLIPSYGMVILALVHARGWISHLLSMRPLVVLGESSYAIYLLHLPLWGYMTRVHAIDTLPRWLLFIAILIPMSIASFFFIERPSRKAILQLVSARSKITPKPAMTVQ